jgi:hypothetical protein
MKKKRRQQSFLLASGIKQTQRGIRAEKRNQFHFQFFIFQVFFEPTEKQKSKEKKNFY